MSLNLIRYSCRWDKTSVPEILDLSLAFSRQKNYFSPIIFFFFHDSSRTKIPSVTTRLNVALDLKIAGLPLASWEF